MSELTDLQICKKIAEIEGYHTNLAIKCEGVWCSMNDNNCYGVFNPLTDDALCFQLTKKYRVSIDYFEDWQRQGEDKDVLARLEIGLGIHALGTVDFCKNDDSLNKAICLAIIEAHKEQS